MSKSSDNLPMISSHRDGLRGNTASWSLSHGDSSDEYCSDLHNVIQGALQQHQLLQQRNDLYMEQLAVALAVSSHHEKSLFRHGKTRTCVGNTSMASALLLT